MTVDRGYVVRDARPDDRDAIRNLTLDAYAEYGEIMEPDSWAGLSAAVQCRPRVNRSDGAHRGRR